MNEAQKIATESWSKYINKADKFLKWSLSPTYKEDTLLVFVQLDVMISIKYLEEYSKLKKILNSNIKASGASQVAEIVDDTVNLSRSQKKHIGKLDNLIKDHLKETDFSGALRDLQGNPVPKPGGGYWNHLGEMKDTLTGLKRVQSGLEGSLKNPNLNSATRELLKESLDKATLYIQRINDLGIK